MRKQLKIGAILSYLAVGIRIMVSIIYTPIMLRILSQREYGLYQQVVAVISQLSIINAGFGASYIRFYSRYQAKDDEEKVSDLNGMFLTVLFLLSIVATIAGFGLSQFPELVFGSKYSVAELELARILMIILSVNLGFSFINLLFNSYIVAKENFIFQRALEVLQALVSPFVQLPLLWLGYGSLGLVIATTVISVSVYAFNIYYCFKKLDMKISLNSFDFSLFKEIRHYSFFIFIAMIIDQINWNVDIYLVGRFYGAAAAAIYSIAELLDSYFRNFSSIFSSLLTPRIHMLVSKEASNEKMTQVFTQAGRLQFVIIGLFASGFVFFGRPFIQFWAGESYVDAYPIGVILILPLIIPIIQNTGMEIRRAKNKQKFYTWISFFTALLNVLITIYLLSIMPPIGAAISTSLTLLLNALVLNWYYHAHLGLDIFFFWKNILSVSKALLIPLIFGIFLVFKVNLYQVNLFLIYGLAYVLIYLLSMWFFGINQEEKNLLLESFRTKKN